MNKRGTITFWILALLGLLAVFARPVSAQQPAPTPSDNDVNRVAKQMYCPVCENIPLDVCPTQACSEWRELIRLKLSEGWSDEQIKVYFAQQYGDRVLAEPPRRGLNWLVYVLPVAFFLIGAFVLWRVLFSMKRSTAAPAESDPSKPEGAGADDPYLKKLEEELKRRD